ncbi:MAG: phage tail assembly protein [Sulfurovum sp.]|nr:phage tail assembly protein [Sulfurovum sp.]
MQSANFTVALPKPIEFDGKEVTELTFREPVGADMEAFLGEMVPQAGGKPDMGKSVTAIAAATVVSHPLTEDDFRAMHAKNYMAVAMEIMGFLA